MPLERTKWDDELVESLTRDGRPGQPQPGRPGPPAPRAGRPLDYTLGRVGWLFRRVPDKDDLLCGAVLVAGLFAWVKGGLSAQPRTA